MPKYKFNLGDRVCAAHCFRLGEVVGQAAGNGSIEWYYVRWDDGSEDRYVAEELSLS